MVLGHGVVALLGWDRWDLVNDMNSILFVGKQPSNTNIEESYRKSREVETL